MSLIGFNSQSENLAGVRSKPSHRQKIKLADGKSPLRFADQGIYGVEFVE
jgi:hypothetical protein